MLTGEIPPELGGLSNLTYLDLNWSADTPITEWNGVVLGGTHGHVTDSTLVLWV